MTTAQTTPTPGTTRRAAPTPGRAFIVVWQHPQTRAFAQVGRLEVHADRYRFRYDAAAADVDGFEPFLAFPELDRTYDAPELFPFVRNRVLSPRRPDYPAYLERLGLHTGDPVEILARSGGGRATDTVHLVPEPVLTDAGCIELRFLASGVRHADPDGTHLSSVAPGDLLALRDDVGNPANPCALLLDNTSGEEVGWVPDYLLDTVRGLREFYVVQVIADVVNGPDTPAHLRLLCLLRATPQT
ncbi:MAG TPA: hypothetical protein VFD39_14670 [Trueperaceae bacterium]|nr:hypothetical protein [Trueperaceae bacterium]